MYVTDYLSVESIELDSPIKNKAEAIEHLVELLKKKGCLLDADDFKKSIIEREQLGSTAIAEGVAIPHAKSKAVKFPGISALIVKEGIDFNAKDEMPAKIFFMIAAPEDNHNLHVEMLGRLAILLISQRFREKLMHIDSKEKFVTFIERMEAKETENIE